MVKPQNKIKKKKKSKIYKYILKSSLFQIPSSHTPSPPSLPYLSKNCFKISLVQSCSASFDNSYLLQRIGHIYWCSKLHGSWVNNTFFAYKSRYQGEAERENKSERENKRVSKKILDTWGNIYLGSSQYLK